MGRGGGGAGGHHVGQPYKTVLVSVTGFFFFAVLVCFTLTVD